MGNPFVRFDSNDSLSVSLPSINVRRNLLTYSEQFDNGVWFKARASVSLSSTLGPNGNVAFKLVEDTTSSNTHYIYRNPTASAGTNTGYFILKAGERIYASVQAYNATDGDRGVTYFNLSTGKVVSGVGFIKPLTNGWYVCGVTATSTVTDRFDLRMSSNGTSQSYTGDGVSGIYIAGAQVELGSTATDYQKITDWTSEAYSSNGSVYFATPVGMSSLHNQSMGTSFTLPALSSDIYSWIVVPQRLSTVQESRLERYMNRKAGIAGPDYFEQVDYGPELVTNGDFSNGTTGWTVLSGITISNGQATYQLNGNSAIFQPISLVAGKTYKVSITVISKSGSTSADFQACNDASGAGGGSYNTFSMNIGENVIYYMHSGSATGFRIRNTGSNGTTSLVFDNISIRELKDGMTGQLFADDGEQLLLAQ